MATVICGAFGTGKLKLRAMSYQRSLTLYAITYQNLVVHDWSLIKMGIRNNCIVLLICLLVGYLYALIAILW